ncbi:MAG: MFS transporter [Candidatus Woesearchaeota archaeon]
MKNIEITKYYSIVFWNQLIRNFVFLFFPLFFLDIGLNGFEQGLILGIYTITGLLFSFHLGIKTDQMDQRILLIIGILLFLAFCAGLVIFRNVWMIGILFFLGGLSNIILVRATDTLVFKATSKKMEGREMGIYSVIKVFPFIIGIIIGAYIITRFGFDYIFVLSAFLFLLLFFPIISMKKTKLFNFPVTHYLNDLKNKEVLYFCIVIFIFGLHWGAEQTSYSPFLKLNLGLNMIQSSYYMACVIVALIITAYITGILIDRGASVLKLLSTSILLSGLGGALFAMTNNLIFSFLMRIVHEIGDGIFTVILSIGILRLFDKKRIGGNAGFIMVIVVLSAFTGSLIFGPIGFNYGYNLPHIISGMLSIIAFIMIMFFRRIKG